MDKKPNQNNDASKAEQGSGDQDPNSEVPEAANATSGSGVANQQAHAGASASNTASSLPQANRVRERERPHNRSTSNTGSSSSSHGGSSAAASCLNANSHVSRIHGKGHHRGDHHHRGERHRDAKLGTAPCKDRHQVHQAAAAAVPKGTPSSSSSPSPSRPSTDKDFQNKTSGIPRVCNTNVAGAASSSGATSKQEASISEPASPPSSPQCSSSSPPLAAATGSSSASSSSSSSAPIPDDEPIGAEDLHEAVGNDEPPIVLQVSPSLPPPSNGVRVAEYFPPVVVDRADNAPNVPQNPPSNPSNSQNHVPVHNMEMYNWQSSKYTIKERLAFMFNNDTMADVHFVVGRNPHTQRIPAHKFVLAIGSAVFDAMFNGGMATTCDEIEIPDVEPAAFMALLKFLYSDDVQIDPETVMTTLYTAKKYVVPALECACVEFLKRNLSSDNAFMLLTQARLFDEPQLAALCLETIDKNTSEALSAEGFTDIDLDTLCVVLERDTLGIRECKLFYALCRWSESECIRQSLSATSHNKRQCLGRALSLIRFPLMTVEEFAMGPAQSNLLVDREVVELFLYFTVNPKPVVTFSETPRCCLTGKEQVVSRFCQIESRWGYSGTSDRIRFMVNRRIFVVGFGLYGSIHGPAEYTVNIQIIHTDTGKVCGQSDTSFQCDGTNSTFRVMFKEPVEIQANTSYTACATLKGPDSYYGTKGLRKVTHESISSGKVTFQFTYAAGNNNGTSVEDGQLPEIIFYT